MKGFTLVEVLVAMAILAVGILGTSLMIKKSLSMAHRSFELTDSIYSAKDGFAGNEYMVRTEEIHIDRSANIDKLTVNVPRADGKSDSYVTYTR